MTSAVASDRRAVVDGDPFWEASRSTDGTLHERRRREITTLLAGCLEMRTDDGRLTPRNRLCEMHLECFASRPFRSVSLATSHRNLPGRRVAIVRCRDGDLSVDVQIIISRREQPLTTPEAPISGVTNAFIFLTSPHSGDTNDLSQSDPTTHYRCTTTGPSRIDIREDNIATVPRVP